MSEKTALEKAKWEAQNNSAEIQVKDPLLGLISVDAMLLISPWQYSNPQMNSKRRLLAIEQGTFKPAPEDF